MLENKFIVILGGAGLIGQGFTTACLNEGAHVLVGGRNIDASTNIFDDLPAEHKPRLSFQQVDVTCPESVGKVFEIANNAGSTIDAVVNCTFPYSDNYGAPFEDVSHQHFCDNISMHLGSTFLICQKAIAYFKENGRGNLVNISSIYGVMTPRFEIYKDTQMTKEIEYIISKSGIIHMTKYLAKYLKGKNIRVNCISPGGVFNEESSIFTERYKSHCLNKGMLEPNDIAGALLFLLSEHSTYINGQNIVVDDGFSL